MLTGQLSDMLLWEPSHSVQLHRTPNLNTYEAEVLSCDSRKHWTNSSISPLCCSTDISFVKNRTSFISLSPSVLQVNSVVNASWQKEVYILCNNTHCHSLEEKILQGQPAPMWHNDCFAKQNRWLKAGNSVTAASPSARLVTSVSWHIWRLICILACSGPANLNTNTLCRDQRSGRRWEGKAGGLWRKCSLLISAKTEQEIDKTKLEIY